MLGAGCLQEGMPYSFWVQQGWELGSRGKLPEGDGICSGLKTKAASGKPERKGDFLGRGAAVWLAWGTPEFG